MHRWWCTEVVDTEVDDVARVLVRRALLCEWPREHTGWGSGGGKVTTHFLPRRVAGGLASKKNGGRGIVACRRAAPR